MRTTTLSALALSGIVACSSPEEPVVPEGPVEWSVEASVDKDEVQVGEDLLLTLTVRHPVGGEFIAPAAVALEPFEMIETTEEEVSPVETRVHFRIAAYRLPETLEVPALELRYRDEADEVRTLTTEPIAVELVTSLTPDVTEIHDIKDPVALEVERDWSLLWWLLAALAAAILAYIIYRKLRKEPETGAETPWVPPLPPAEDEAEAALRRLAERELLEKGELETFFTELSEIMKRYAGRRFEVAWLERTTGEILTDLTSEKLRGDPHMRLRAVLEAADLVKFARLSPDAEEGRKSFRRAEEFLAETRRKPEPGAESEPSEKRLEVSA